MFDFITTRSRRVPDASALTTMIAAVLHTLVLAVIVVGTLAATDVMPAPPGDPSLHRHRSAAATTTAASSCGDAGDSAQAPAGQGAA